MIDASAHPRQLLKASVWGVSWSWPLAVAALLGFGLMVLPTAFGLDIQSAAADIGHLGGALAITISIIALGEVVRIGRYLNLPLGLFVAIAPWIWTEHLGYSIVCSLAGGLIFLLSLPRGPKIETYGGWDRFIR